MTKTKTKTKQKTSRPPAEPDDDAVSTFSVQGGEHILPSAFFPLPTVDGQIFVLGFFLEPLCAHTLPVPINEVDSERTDILF